MNSHLFCHLVVLTCYVHLVVLTCMLVFNVVVAVVSVRDVPEQEGVMMPPERLEGHGISLPHVLIPSVH